MPANSRNIRLLSFIPILIFSLFSCLSYGQQKEAADNLVQEGVMLQDRGQADSAMARFDRALELDKDNVLALCEMAYSFLSQNNYEMTVLYCKRAFKTHPRDIFLKTAYVSYGNALDGMGKSAKAIDAYNDGIKLFPDYYQLWYNKGISQNMLHKTEDALLSFQQSIILNPDHASSHNAIGHLQFNNNNIASLLAFCRFMVLENKGTRAEQNLANIRKITNAHIRKSDEGNVSVMISPDMLAPAKKSRPNNFGSAELMLTMSAALDLDSANINKTETQNFVRKFSSLCEFMKETQRENSGFYWDYYAPYFMEMNDKGLIETFGYIIFSSSQTDDVKDWLAKHKNEVTDFYSWSDKFPWHPSSGK